MYCLLVIVFLSKHSYNYFVVIVFQHLQRYIESLIPAREMKWLWSAAVRRFAEITCNAYY